MKIKTFYSKTMAEAFKEIKTHLGPNAILLSTKEIPRRSGVWGQVSGFEVVAACDDAGAVDFFSEAEGGDGSAGSARRPETGARKDLAHILATGTYTPARLAAQQAVAHHRRSPAGTASLSGGITEFPERSENEDPLSMGRIAGRVRLDLIGSGIDAELADRLVSTACEGLTPSQCRNRGLLLGAVARAALKMVPAISDRDGIPGKRIVAFVGPTGVGKTTSIAKLAAHLALRKKKKVLLVTTDGYRIGAIDQLRAYAGFMGIPFRFADQVPDLARTIEEHRQRDFILVDTAGRSPRDMNAIRPIAEFLGKSGDTERHLVLSVTTNSRDLRAAMDAFEICAPDHLLFTKLDETAAAGPILNEIIRTRKSFSFYSDGQKVPEDLHAVTGEFISDLILNRKEVSFKE
ncbi:MAG: flagellar biosynthesis protein FlhF [Acidobacteria bacterium]|nr:flagellar biosynthesis protein FlhF [Acidobacteriota bacterium]